MPTGFSLAERDDTEYVAEAIQVGEILRAGAGLCANIYKAK